MKCDKLKAEPMIINDDYTALYYLKESVDAAIDELKEKIDGQKWRGDEWARAANDKEKQIAELKAENRKLKRELWLARANKSESEARGWYHSNAYIIKYDGLHNIKGVLYGKGFKRYPDEWMKLWIKIESLCLAKAEELK